MNAKTPTLGLTAWLLLLAAGGRGAALLTVEAVGADLAVCRSVVDRTNACHRQCWNTTAGREFGPCGTAAGKICAAQCCPTDPALQRCLQGLEGMLGFWCQRAALPK